jgi:mannose-6-phosphate isomerase-like protein (cupin superfamily)
MPYEIQLKQGRGTPLWRNGDKDQRLYIQAPKNVPNMDLSQLMMIIDGTLAPAHHLGMMTAKGFSIFIQPNVPYQVMNTTLLDIGVLFDEDPRNHEVIYDPYKYEFEDHSDYDPDEFKKANPVPDGYVDTLPKWYSVKYTYPTFNYIFVRPGVGISLQTHRMREEHWEILRGKPMIINDAKVHYDVEPGTKFLLPLGSMHAVINPSNTEWVLLKEEYAGEFDEKDIIRIFNPNNYH